MICRSTGGVWSVGRVGVQGRTHEAPAAQWRFLATHKRPCVSFRRM